MAAFQTGFQTGKGIFENAQDAAFRERRFELEQRDAAIREQDARLRQTADARAAEQHNSAMRTAQDAETQRTQLAAIYGRMAPNAKQDAEAAKYATPEISGAPGGLRPAARTGISQGEAPAPRGMANPSAGNYGTAAAPTGLALEELLRQAAAVSRNPDAVRKSVDATRAINIDRITAESMQATPEQMAGALSKLNTNAVDVPLLFTEFRESKLGTKYEYVLRGEGGRPGAKITLNESQNRALYRAARLAEEGFGAEALAALKEANADIAKALDAKNNMTLGLTNANNNVAKLLDDAANESERNKLLKDHYASQDARARDANRIAASKTPEKRLTMFDDKDGNPVAIDLNALPKDADGVTRLPPGIRAQGKGGDKIQENFVINNGRVVGAVGTNGELLPLNHTDNPYKTPKAQAQLNAIGVQQIVYKNPKNGYYTFGYASSKLTEPDGSPSVYPSMEALNTDLAKVGRSAGSGMPPPPKSSLPSKETLGGTEQGFRGKGYPSGR